jgi:VanZ family protein
LTPGFKIFLATALTAAYALTDEFHQTLTPERAGLLSDVLIDTTAGLIGSILCALTSWVLYTPKTKSRKRKELKALWRKNQVHLDRIKAKLSPKKT